MESFTDNASSTSTQQKLDFVATEPAANASSSAPIIRYEEEEESSTIIMVGGVRQPRDDDVDDNERLSKIVRISVAILLVLSVTYFIVDSFGDRHVEATIMKFLEWVSENPYEGVLAVICVYIVATVLFVPGSFFTLGTGYAFGSACDNTAYGVFLASTAVFIGASLGSLCTFLLGRYLFRGCVLRLAATYPIFQAVDRALEGNGLKIMILLRLSPLIPYNALNYMSGVTSISFGSYALALIGILPGTVMFCFVGATASRLTDSTSSTNKTVQIVTVFMGLLFAVCGVDVASYYSKRELDRILAADAVGETMEEMGVSLSNNNASSYRDTFENEPGDENGTLSRI